jgi:hypothetical protein
MRTCLLILCAAVTLSFATPAHAQAAAEPKAPGTAIAGMGLLGGELGASLGTIFGIRKAPVLFAVTSVGLATGLVCGIFANKIQAPVRHDIVGVSTLVLGMGGAIPAVLIVLQVRSKDSLKTDKDKKKKGKESTALLVPPGLFNVSDGEFHLSAPSIVPLVGREKEKPVGAVLFSGSF